jgi:hypothetical protein
MKKKIKNINELGEFELIKHLTETIKLKNNSSKLFSKYIINFQEEC